MPTCAKGTFQVRLTPQGQENKTQESTPGRVSIEKQFHGDLEATSKGEMLSAGTAVKGSAAYLAIERVSGTLHGRTGSFILKHRGIMTHGAPQLATTVAPDSGTGQLTDLAGKMAITTADGKHSYEFGYTLPEAT
jgi:hypothetical protein